MMLRRLVATLLLLFVAVGDAEGVLTTACDVGAEMAERVGSVPTDAEHEEAPQENCHCAHAHLQTVVAAERVTRASVPAAVAPIAFAESAPASADRATPLRPPRV
jgi:hypothetical protein